MGWFGGSDSTSSATDNRIAATDQARVFRGSVGTNVESGGLAVGARGTVVGAGALQQGANSTVVGAGAKVVTKTNNSKNTKVNTGVQAMGNAKVISGNKGSVTDLSGSGSIINGAQNVTLATNTTTDQGAVKAALDAITGVSGQFNQTLTSFIQNQNSAALQTAAAAATGSSSGGGGGGGGSYYTPPDTTPSATATGGGALDWVKSHWTMIALAGVALLGLTLFMKRR
jgi:hypothetical protein